MARYALEYRGNQDSKEFKTTRRQFIKYLKRHKEEILEGLKDKPKNI